MAYLLFVDESGQDHRHSPYEVLAGAAIHDRNLWTLVNDIHAVQESIFGMRISTSAHEVKAKALLKTKTFRLASQHSPIGQSERVRLARSALLDGSAATRRELTALAQAKLAFCSEVLRLCASHGVYIFASIVGPDSPRPGDDVLRKDYAYLLERFFYFLDQQPAHERGLVIFDELERSRAHILLDQMGYYFRRTANGRMRVSRIVPEPLFVHSDLTSGILIADLAAYVISWNVRFGTLKARKRPELDSLGAALMNLRHRAVVERDGYPDGFVVWSFSAIDDLRPRGEQGLIEMPE